VEEWLQIRNIVEWSLALFLEGLEHWPSYSTLNSRSCSLFDHRFENFFFIHSFYFTNSSFVVSPFVIFISSSFERGTHPGLERLIFWGHSSFRQFILITCDTGRVEVENPFFHFTLLLDTLPLPSRKNSESENMKNKSCKLNSCMQEIAFIPRLSDKAPSVQRVVV
jgi:hypothetical protein